MIFGAAMGDSSAQRDLPGRGRRRWRRGVAAAVALACGAAGAGLPGGCSRDARSAERTEEEHAAAAKLPGAVAIGSPGTTPGRFYTPRCIDNDGEYLWVIDRSARVQRLDPVSGHCVQWFKMPESELGKPTGLTIAPSPRGHGERALYIADTHYHRVMIYALPAAPAGGTSAQNEYLYPVDPIAPELIVELGKYGNAAGEFVYPCCVAVVPRIDGAGVERLYVSEFGGNDRVQIFDGDMKPVSAFGTLGAGDRDDILQFNRPQCVVIDAARQELVIADSINQRVGRFTMEGKPLGWIGAATQVGTGPGEFRHPRGLTLLKDGTVLVVEFGNNRVQRIDPRSGKSLGMWGEAGTRLGEFAEPWAMTILKDRAYVVEAKTNRVTGFDVQW